MAKILEWQTQPTYSIPLEIAMLCVNCDTVSNSLPHRCSVCGSQAVVRLISLLDPEPDPPASNSKVFPFFYTHAVSA